MFSHKPVVNSNPCLFTNMKCFQAYLPILLFLLLTATPPATATAIANYAMPGCNDTCGNNVTIPFPFGIGADCSVNPWYNVNCSSSKPYLPALNNLEVLRVDLENLTVTVSKPRITACQSPVLNSTEINGVDLDGSPFLFSKSQNEFVFAGCGTAALVDNGSVLTGCSATCGNVTPSDRNNCFGIGCCQTTIPYHLNSYSVNLTGLESQGENGGCTGSAFLVDKTLYEQARYSDPFIPISLLWTLTMTDSENVTCCTDASLQRRKVVVFGDTPVDAWICSNDNGKSLEGNPYLVDGCRDYELTEECRRCRDSGGYCERDEIYDIDGSLFSRNFSCNEFLSSGSSKRLSPGVIIGICICMTAVLAITICRSSKIIKKTITKRRRKSVFKRINGGLLLKQQEEVDPSLVDKTILFTSRDLAKATDNFNENRVLGKGGQGTVYKGMLADGRIVAVKKSKLVNESQIEQFINEVVILSQINHRNVVKLLGCCLETEVPLLVSEFISNGTLYDRIHDESHELPLSLNMRLQIATDVAQAVSYLHSATCIPIYHRDIKTTNILLDDKYRGKVSDFGTSRFVSADQTHLSTLVKGTLGYLDPEYFQTSQITEKSDVYSFGVVLAELLTGERPISLTRFDENRSLATHFMLAIEEGRAMSIFDAIVIKEGTRDGLLILADLAMRCLNTNGKLRPSMHCLTITRNHHKSTSKLGNI
ncbi:putative protein kinase RLK-Pelle-WAK family [Helianthus debilis subsp. tardiflorus]